MNRLQQESAGGNGDIGLGQLGRGRGHSGRHVRLDGGPQRGGGHLDELLSAGHLLAGDRAMVDHELQIEPADVLS